MIINHPLLGPRDANEFIHLGDESMIDRPDGMAEHAAKNFHDIFLLDYLVCKDTNENSLQHFHPYHLLDQS